MSTKTNRSVPLLSTTKFLECGVLQHHFIVINTIFHWNKCNFPSHFIHLCTSKHHRKCSETLMSAESYFLDNENPSSYIEDMWAHGSSFRLDWMHKLITSHAYIISQKWIHAWSESFDLRKSYPGGQTIFPLTLPFAALTGCSWHYQKWSSTSGYHNSKDTHE